MIDQKIKTLRENRHITQAELARALNVTRSCVNAWEMGISLPSTQYIVELSDYFNIPTDFLLKEDHTTYLDTEGLEDNDILLLHDIISHLRNQKRI